MPFTILVPAFKTLTMEDIAGERRSSRKNNVVTTLSRTVITRNLSSKLSRTVITRNLSSKSNSSWCGIYII